MIPMRLVARYEGEPRPQPLDDRFSLRTSILICVVFGLLGWAAVVTPFFM